MHICHSLFYLLMALESPPWLHDLCYCARDIAKRRLKRPISFLRPPALYECAYIRNAYESLQAHAAASQSILQKGKTAVEINADEWSAVPRDKWKAKDEGLRCFCPLATEEERSFAAASRQIHSKAAPALRQMDRDSFFRRRAKRGRRARPMAITVT
jgi:hypothetical protein